jgi:hypothetical protein
MPRWRVRRRSRRGQPLATRRDPPTLQPRWERRQASQQPPPSSVKAHPRGGGAPDVTSDQAPAAPATSGQALWNQPPPRSAPEVTEQRPAGGLNSAFGPSAAGSQFNATAAGHWNQQQQHNSNLYLQRRPSLAVSQQASSRRSARPRWVRTRTRVPRRGRGISSSSHPQRHPPAQASSLPSARLLVHRTRPPRRRRVGPPVGSREAPLRSSPHLATAATPPPRREAQADGDRAHPRRASPRPRGGQARATTRRTQARFQHQTRRARLSRHSAADNKEMED